MHNRNEQLSESVSQLNAVVTNEHNTCARHQVINYSV